MTGYALPDVFTAREIAAAAGVPDGQVLALIARGEIRTVASVLPEAAAEPGLDAFVPAAEAVRVVRALKAGEPVGASTTGGIRRLFAAQPHEPRRAALPMLAATSAHAAAALVLLAIASLGLATAANERTEPIDLPKEPVRMVFLALPGPGGGGGGGGMKVKAPPPKAERKGPAKISSPIPARKLPPPVRPAPRPKEPPPTPLDAKTLPPVMAPVATVKADERDREGVMEEAPPQAPPSPGPGEGGGTGSGRGTGLGEGQGSGIGPGEGGGTGGGPYRPGSGVDPPRLLREVRADYTDSARRAGIEGEVVMEIVVRRDGTVGDVRLLRGLDAGLNQRAIQAVRQWRFAPARLKGTPVDVVVEVAVEFKLR